MPAGAEEVPAAVVDWPAGVVAEVVVTGGMLPEMTCAAEVLQRNKDKALLFVFKGI